MKKVFLLAFATAFVFTACKDVKIETGPSDGSGSGITIEHEGHEGDNHDHEEHSHSTENPSTTSSKDVKLNPPHGEPGHRCEITVGAPLDGSAAPAQTAPTPAQPQAQPDSGKGFLGSGNTQPQQAPNAQVAQQAPPAQQTAPGMQGKPNPAHGQPGHRCDVQVGQPLP